MKSGIISVANISIKRLFIKCKKCPFIQAAATTEGPLINSEGKLRVKHPLMSPRPTFST